MMRFLVLPVVLFVLSPVLHAADARISLERDVTYATIDKQKLVLDIARPGTPGPHPVVVAFHGGAWKYGNKSDLSGPQSYDIGGGAITKSLIERIAEDGFVAVSVGYRLAPANKWPAQIEDAKTAVRFLRANAKQYGIDPEHVAAVGFSAGGHLAALLGTCPKEAGLEGTLYAEQSSKVQCVVDFFGPADLSLYAETPGIETAYMVPFLGARYANQPEIYKKASPVLHVTKDAPPFLIIHGTADVIVPIIHSERLNDKLAAAGVKSQLITIKGKGHGWGGETAAETNAKMLKFLAEQLKGQK